MFSRYLVARSKAIAKQLDPNNKIEKKEIEITNPQSKKVYAFVDNKVVGIYDSITLCASALGMSRAMIKKAIESGVVLDNGFNLKLTDK